MKYRCSVCGVYKTADSFYKDKGNIGGTRPGIGYTCRGCLQERNSKKDRKDYQKKYKKKWKRANPEYHAVYNRKYRKTEGCMSYQKDYSKRYHLLRTYGLTFEEVDDLLRRQDNGCAICGNVMTEGRGADSMVVDHDHFTGKVRGLLCRSCNGALGFFKDNIESLKKAIKYLTV